MAKLSKTKALAIVLEEFERRKEALSFVNLARDLTDHMNRTTVYRILKRLEKDGQLHSFTGKDGLRWYAMNDKALPDGHYTSYPHFQCEDCGKTECLPLEVDIPDLPHHKIASVSLLYVGQCSNCEEKRDQ